MAREPAEPLALDYLLKVGAAHSMTGATFRSVGVRGAEIVAVSAEQDGLDDLPQLVWDLPDCAQRLARSSFSLDHPWSSGVLVVASISYLVSLVEGRSVFG